MQLVPKNIISSWTKFWRLTTTWKREYRQRKSDRRVYWECKCDCWNIHWVAANNLKCWNVISCWCAAIDYAKNQWTHYMTKERIYRTRVNMRERCNNPKDKSFSRYWWRWICVCDEWNNSFEKFYEDMWGSYKKHVELFWEKNTQIDRIDVNWNYCKENCRRATIKEQAMNQRPYKRWHRAKEYWFTLKDIADKFNIWRWAVSWRLCKWYKWDILKLINDLEKTTIIE